MTQLIKNICFGVNEDQIDFDMLNKVINISGIDEFIKLSQIS